MTRIEVIVVLIVALVLVELLFPLGPNRRRHAPIAKAQLQAAAITAAIEGYKSVYGRYPISTNLEMEARNAKEDFTFGGRLLNHVLGPGVETLPNSEVISVLMDITNYPNGTATANGTCHLNPRHIIFLTGHFSGDTHSPGVGTDLVYRNPWGHPYVISMDLNGDGCCCDALYEKSAVSRENAATGFDGLTNATDATEETDSFEYPSDVMVWSFGSDGKADKSRPADVPPNKDNIFSWQ